MWCHTCQCVSTDKSKHFWLFGVFTSLENNWLSGYCYWKGLKYAITSFCEITCRRGLKLSPRLVYASRPILFHLLSIVNRPDNITGVILQQIKNVYIESVVPGNFLQRTVHGKHSYELKDCQCIKRTSAVKESPS